MNRRVRTFCEGHGSWDGHALAGLTSPGQEGDWISVAQLSASASKSNRTAVSRVCREIVAVDPLSDHVVSR